MEDSEEARASISITRWAGHDQCIADDLVVAEEPLEIRLNDTPYAMTMRTPGDDAALAAGFLATEGVLRDPSDLFDITRCAEADHPDQLNIVTVYARPERAPADLSSGRQRYASSSCGLCGRASIEAVRQSAPLVTQSVRVQAELLYELPDRMRQAQQVFHRTGGLHAAALFDLDGALLFLAEDVGRHNAVDKVIGRALMAGRWPPGPCVLMVSGRAGFEIVQKACMVGIPLVCSVSAPSSLAIDLAHETGLTLVGFLRDRTMNVYSGAERITH